MEFNRPVLKIEIISFYIILKKILVRSYIIRDHKKGTVRIQQNEYRDTQDP